MTEHDTTPVSHTSVEAKPMLPAGKSAMRTHSIPLQPHHQAQSLTTAQFPPICDTCARTARRRRRAQKTAFYAFVALFTTLSLTFWTAAALAALHNTTPTALACSGVGTLTIAILTAVTTLVHKAREKSVTDGTRSAS